MELDRTIDELTFERETVSGMKRAIGHAIDILLEANPVFGASLRERLEVLVEQRSGTWTRPGSSPSRVAREVLKAEQSKAQDIGFSARGYAIHGNAKAHRSTTADRSAERENGAVRDFASRNDGEVEPSTEVVD